MTHYIPAYTERRLSRLQRAVCGVWIREQDHSAEPACAQCAAWLDADSREAAALAAKWDAEASCRHDWQEQPGEPPRDTCSLCGAVRW